MLKAAAFVCVIALGTFLAVTADSGGKSESDNDQHEARSSTTKALRQTTNNSEGNDTDSENMSLDDDDSEGFLATDVPNQTSQERRDNGNPTCSSPPEIEGAIAPRVEGTELEVGTSVTYSCKLGYVSRNFINHISTCTFNETTEKAEWTVPELACIPRSCGDPGYVSNARRIGNLFTFPNKVEYECDEGYKIRGLRTRYCQAGGDWSGKVPICEQIYCTVPSDPVNGRVRYSSLEYGTELKYECNAEFLLKKHERRFCSKDGRWSGDEPECSEARCEEPLSPEHGTVRLSGDPKVGSLATYSCDAGKMLIGASTTKCLITGQWTFDPPKCISFCYVPDVKNGELGRFENRSSTRWRIVTEFKKVSRGTQVNHNATLILRCNEDFLPTDESNTYKKNELEVTCNDGIWSKGFWCRQTSCNSEPPNIEHGRAVISSRRHGTTISYNCLSNKYTKVSGHISCQFGEWRGYTPKCLDSPCKTSELNFLGLIKPEEELLATMSSFDIVCENGFTKASLAEYVTCINGEWNITQSPCIRDPLCYTSELHYPGLEKPSREFFGSYEHFNITCKNGFRKTTLKRIITCVEGKWDSTEDPCNGAPCKTSELNFLGLIKPEEELLATMSSFHIVCENGFTKASLAENVTCINGEWNITQSPCIRNSLCYTSELHYPGLEIPSREFFGSYEHFNIRCKNGFRKTPLKRIITCVEGKWDSTEDPCNGVSNTRCPPIHGIGIFSFYYDNDRRINSTAQILCKEHGKRVEGCAVATCLPNGTWSGSYPECVDYVSCPRFQLSPGLAVSYSKGVSVGSQASFTCSRLSKLIGSSYAICQNNGTWNNPSPICKGAYEDTGRHMKTYEDAPSLTTPKSWLHESQ